MVINEKEYAKIIAKNLRELTFRKDVSQKEIAENIGVSPAIVSSWMNAKKTPRMKNIDALCEYFGCKRSDIMEPRLHKSDGMTADRAEAIRLIMQASDENVTFVIDLLKRLEDIK